MKIVAAIVIACGLALGGCANVAFRQDSDKARILVGALGDDPRQTPPVTSVAPFFAQYAWLALRAYDDSLYGLKTGHKSDIDQCPAGEDCRLFKKRLPELHAIWGAKPIITGINDCSPEAERTGVVRRDFGHEGKPGQCGIEPEGRHRLLDGLGIQIWMRRDCSEMVVAFRGTDFHQSDDWLSNFRWVTRVLPLHDQYEQAREHVDLMIDAAIAKRGCTPRRITAIGHSLGGGLAQHAAYSQIGRKGRPNITRVYAFDPSFVTGFRDRALRGERLDRAVRGLRIDRIYEHGEILAYPRFFLRQIETPAACDPQVRLVRFNLLTGSVGEQHSMSALTRKLIEASPPPALAPLREDGILPTGPEAIGETGNCTPEALYNRRYRPGDRTQETMPDISLISAR
jgi:pimeloyl-ACP methyl ester carboxylesterase